MSELPTTENKVRTRNPRTTKLQIDIIVNFLEENKILILGKVEPKNLAKVESLWIKLSNSLNNAGKGPQKSVEEWKTVVRELKNNVKKRSREVHVEKTATGGGPRKNKELSEVEERIMGLISKVSIEGAAVPEAGICNAEEELDDLNLIVHDITNSETIQANEDTNIIFEDVSIAPENVNLNRTSNVNKNVTPSKPSTKRGKYFKKFTKPPSNVNDLAVNVKEQTQALKELAVAMTALSCSISTMATSLNNIAEALNK